MAIEKVDNKLNVVIGTKAQIDGDTSIPENSIVVVTDEELKADEIVYSSGKNVKEAIDEKQDKLVAGANITIDPDTNVISASGGNGGGEYTETDPIFTAWDKSTGISITKSQVSDFSHNHDDRYYTEVEINTLLNAKLNTSLKGSVNGLAELGADGKVPSSQLPSYVDDVLEYTSFSNFPTTGESSKIYISQDTNKTYRWGGSGYIEISASLALGETSSTAGRGDWTKTAYDHTLLTNNPHGVTTAQIGAEPAFSKNTAFNKNFGTTAGTVAQGNHLHTGVYEPANANIQSHISSTSNPHGVTKTQVGLGNVDNTSDLNKPISTATQSALDNKVDKVAGKGLSTNDYTTTEKNKLAGIASGAEVNVKPDWNAASGNATEILNKPTIDQLLGNLSALGFVKRTGTNTYQIDTSTYQPLDADLTSIAGLSGTSGLLKKTASNTWTLDTSVYLTSITKAMVETVLTGTITTHTHNASAIVEDATHRFVTDAEKNTWNAKQSALGFTPENQANKKTTLTNNDVDFPTTKAVKTAIDTAISQTLKPMGNWNASTNTPTLTNSDTSKANQVYYVSVAGTQFGISFGVGDELVYNTNGVIFKRDNVDAVISVNGKEGVVVLTQDDVADGSTYKRVTEIEKTTWNGKVTSNAAITGSTKTKITYDSKGLVTAGADLVATDIPTLEISKITGLQTALDDKLDKNNAITGATKTKITYDSKGLVTAGADLVESDIPTLSPTKITQNSTNRFVTDAQISTWNNKQESLPTITQSQIDNGTSTTAVVITPKLLRDNFYTESEIDNMIGDIESVLDTILGV